MTRRVWPMADGRWAVQERGYGAMGWGLWINVATFGNEWDARAAMDAMDRAEAGARSRVWTMA